MMSCLVIKTNTAVEGEISFLIEIFQKKSMSLSERNDNFERDYKP